ncbi:MAG: hypothetical protein IJ809_00560 [Clostridia bacterium]|nr:hypothetical protein [Clostridia bacterium]
MAMENANIFVERLFEDDIFIKTVLKKRNFNKNERTSEEIENEKIVKIANEMGFEFSIDEYKTACKAYMNKIDGWEASQKIFHILKIASDMYYEY